MAKKGKEISPKSNESKETPVEKDNEEVKEPPKKRQKTDKSEKPKEQKKDKKKKQSDEETEDQDTTAQQTTIRQVKKIEEKEPFTDQEAEQVIAEWMEKQNRPYSVQNLLDNFQHQLKRTQCIKILDQLVESQILTCKEYGKAKVFLINQDCFPETNPEQLKLLDEQIQVRKEEFAELEEKFKVTKEKLKEASLGQSNVEIINEQTSLLEQITDLKQKLKPYQESGAKMLTEQDLQKAEGDLKKWQLEWKRRNRACMDIVNTISESMEMNRKDFVKKIGIDTDEENKVVCPL